MGFTTYSVRGEKEFFKTFTTGQISTLAVQFSCSRQGYYCYNGYLSEEILVIQYDLDTRQFEGETLKNTVAARNVVSVHE